jgi:hypothetical protein
MEKYYSLHSRFHYVNPFSALNPSSSAVSPLNLSSATTTAAPSAGMPPPVTFNGKLFFSTLTDCNRYCAFLRVICCKIMKFLTIKKLYFYSTCFKRWKSAIYDFKESDLVNSHINIRLLEEREKEEKLRNGGKLLTIQEIKEKMEKEAEIQLMSYLLTNDSEEDVEATPAEEGEKDGEAVGRSKGKEAIGRRKIRHDLLPSADDLRSLPLSITTNPKNNHLMNPSLTLIPNFAEYRQKQKIAAAAAAAAVNDDGNNSTNSNVMIIDDKALLKVKNDEIANSMIFHRPTSPTLGNNQNEANQVNDEQRDSIEETQSKVVRIPGYNPSEGILLPILPIFSRLKTFKDRLYFDLINQPALLSGTAIASSSSSSSSSSASSSASSSSSALANPIYISKDDYYNPMLIHQNSSEYQLYRSVLEGPTSESYWLIPSILMIGNIPYGNAIKQYFEKIPLNFLEIFEKAIKEEEIQEKERIQASFSYSTDTAAGGGGQNTNSYGGPSEGKWTVKGTALTAIAALLLNGIDTFISILSEKEEKLLQYYYQSKRSIEELLNESLERTKSLSRKIITDNLLLIQKQESQLHSIPNFGKSDPRYQQAYNERLRCQGRITLYMNTINTIKNQIKLLPNRIYFYRLSRDGRSYDASMKEKVENEKERDLGCLIPWNLSAILPSVWFIEELIRLGHSIYLYSGSFFHAKDDGPTKDSLSGTLGTIIMGRLYHMKGIDAIFQWQKSHDFMKILHQQLDDSEKRKMAADAASAAKREGDGVDGTDAGCGGNGREEGSIRNPFIPPPPEIQSKDKKGKSNLSSSSSSFRKPIAAKQPSTLSSSASSSSTSSVNPTLSTLTQHGTHLLYRVSCPSLSWQKALILDILDNYSVEWMKYPIIRSQLTPEIYSILERNHYDITLRNQNVYHDLVDYYTSQAYLPFSFQNYRFTTEGDGQNGKTGAMTLQSKNPLLSASLSSQRTTRGKLMMTSSSSSSSSSIRSTSSGIGGGGITIRGDPVAEDDDGGEQEENETIIRVGDRMTISSFSLNKKGVIASTHPLSSSLSSSTTINGGGGGGGSGGNDNQSGKARTVNIQQTINSKAGGGPGGGTGGNGNPNNRGRMTILQKMKLQLQNEENEDILRKEKEAKEKESFNSSEYKEASRQEMILNKSSNYRGKQSIYLEGIVDGNGNKIVHSSSAVLSMKHQASTSSFGGGFSRPSSASSTSTSIGHPQPISHQVSRFSINSKKSV